MFFFYAGSKLKNAKFFAFHIDFPTQTCYYNYTVKRCRESVPAPLVFSRRDVYWVSKFSGGEKPAKAQYYWSFAGF